MGAYGPRNLRIGFFDLLFRAWFKKTGHCWGHTFFSIKKCDSVEYGFEKTH